MMQQLICTTVPSSRTVNSRYNDVVGQQEKILLFIITLSRFVCTSTTGVSITSEGGGKDSFRAGGGKKMFPLSQN